MPSIAGQSLNRAEIAARADLIEALVGHFFAFGRLKWIVDGQLFRKKNNRLYRGRLFVLFLEV